MCSFMFPLRLMFGHIYYNLSVCLRGHNGSENVACAWWIRFNIIVNLKKNKYSENA